MGNSKYDIPEVFDVRIKVDGEAGKELWAIVEGKRLLEHRKTLPETIRAIIMEYDVMKRKSFNRKRSIKKIPST